MAPEVKYLGYMNRDEWDANAFFCWVSERVIPLDEVALLPGADLERCFTAVCDVIIRAGIRGLKLTDCHLFNFGGRISDEKDKYRRHSVLIIDASDRELLAVSVSKSQVNSGCMH